MKEDPIQDRPKTSLAGNILILIAVIALILLPIMAIAIPMTIMEDGLKKYSGIEKHAGEYALQTAESLAHGIDRLHTMYLRVRVERVYVTPPNEARGWCSGPTGSATQGHYSMIVSYRSFFGIQTGTLKMINCAPPFGVFNKNTGDLEMY